MILQHVFSSFPLKATKVANAHSEVSVECGKVNTKFILLCYVFNYRSSAACRKPLISFTFTEDIAKAKDTLYFIFFSEHGVINRMTTKETNRLSVCYFLCVVVIHLCFDYNRRTEVFC